jgi:hypothetical protein
MAFGFFRRLNTYSVDGVKPLPPSKDETDFDIDKLSYSFTNYRPNVLLN